jgi:hypothetical protein
MDKESVTIIYKVYIKLKLFLLYITLIASYFYYKTYKTLHHKILYQTHPMSSLSVCEFAHRVEICLDYINY